MATPHTHPAAGLSPAPWLAAAPFLLPYLVYVLHTLEELQGFAAWASEHFGPETTGTFAAYHIPLMLLVLLTSWRAVLAGRHGGWVVMAAAFQWQFAVNALFHLTAWIALGDYAPGAVTGAVVSIPATVFFFIWIRRQRRATVAELTLAAVIGTLIAALAIGFLFL
ncbi:HXXEE domain-containing protein [Streptomyces iconiensis]|uniref:HXXEE domain-containing protein n=1 Tax=Streptomyces iconiensis TaxID=1384038 RepID=A0ABT6ZYN5_9ACTN|nr:HXXEE domain-containing protein [Streptomyces iconiensis]MDJ1134180.1 HXXEE domain-containing protein [Streptomyces iconiensis]